MVAVGLARRSRSTGSSLVDPAVATTWSGRSSSVLIVAYSLARTADGRALAAGTLMLCAGGIAGTLLDAEPVAVDDILFVAAIMVVGPLVLGRVVRARGELAAALREKSAAGKREREARAAAAVTSERERLAAELDEHISAALTTMVARAATAEQLACSAPDGAEQAFAAIEATGRDALGRDPDRARSAATRGRRAGAGAAALAGASGRPRRTGALGGRGRAARGQRRATAAARRRRPHRVPLRSRRRWAARGRARHGAPPLRRRGGSLIEVTRTSGETTPAAPLGMQERVALYGGELVRTPHPPAGTDAAGARLPLVSAA